MHESTSLALARFAARRDRLCPAPRDPAFDGLAMLHQRIACPVQLHRPHGLEVHPQQLAQGAALAQPGMGRPLRGRMRQAPDDRTHRRRAHRPVHPQLGQQVHQAQLRQCPQSHLLDAHASRTCQFQGIDIHRLQVAPRWRDVRLPQRKRHPDHRVDAALDVRPAVPADRPQGTREVQRIWPRPMMIARSRRLGRRRVAGDRSGAFGGAPGGFGARRVRADRCGKAVRGVSAVGAQDRGTVSVPARECRESTQSGERMASRASSRRIM